MLACMKRIGVDVGGTFTDLILVDEEAGRVTVDKVPSTPDDPSRGVVEGVRRLYAKAGVALSDVDGFLHGTTVAPIWRPRSRRCAMPTRARRSISTTRSTSSAPKAAS